MALFESHFAIGGNDEEPVQKDHKNCLVFGPWVIGQ